MPTQSSGKVPDIADKLQSDLLLWQDRLRLRDWNIKLTIGVAFDKSGLCRKLSDYKEAEIEIIHPDAVRPHWLGNKDPEVTLVHELLHLQGEALDDYIATCERWKDHQERFIELTAIALVNLRRESAGAVSHRA